MTTSDFGSQPADLENLLEFNERLVEWLEEVPTNGDDVRCRTEGCMGDMSDGEGWDGFCGNCADQRDGEDDN
jgi:hypothetical protein